MCGKRQEIIVKRIPERTFSVVRERNSIPVSGKRCDKMFCNGSCPHKCWLEFLSEELLDSLKIKG